MKKTTLLICLIAALAAFVVPAKAAIIVNESTPVDMSIFVPCVNNGAGEVVNLTGFIHTLTTLTDNRNVTSGVSHIQAQGISGVGESTGTQYRVVGLSTMSFKFSRLTLNEQRTETRIIRFSVIGQGSGKVFTMKETAHITVNANGVVTVFFDDFVVECK